MPAAPRLYTHFLLATLILPLPASAADAIEVRARPVALNPEDPDQQTVGGLHYLGGLHLRSPDRRFSELSALHLGRDGHSVVALSDRGYWVTARLVHDASGALASIEDVRAGELRGPEGRDLEAHERDAEAIAPAPDGGYYVSFERAHRIWHYPASDPPFGRAPRALAVPPGLQRAPANEGIEALATLADGRLLALTEGLFDAHGHLVGWVGDGREWSVLAYRHNGGFVPTGAATLPSGDVLVVERRFHILAGLAVRVVLVAGQSIAAGALLEPRELARLAPPLSVDNFEGIDIHVDEAGRTLLYLLSDDNRFLLQRTLLLQFLLAEGD
jgi:hypothetical protein